ncbi:hypothetical protein P4H27_10020 [Paenibacillus taichungensis]|uniref:hypothetical protein n=1 Tax=Paenibacillus taichungensis TaxID=484184 RepID=UPI002DBDF1BD|nr:hypothetical protein [Paenibacillus taichungensis]MEC0107272.1 hypothetical protein [Paenibacillus taichungensis]MEC0194796.1 hypothetical protein [Paenibacillus taichungensis]
MARDYELQMIGFYVLRGHDHEKLLALSPIEKQAYGIWMEQFFEREQNSFKALTGGK